MSNIYFMGSFPTDFNNTGILSIANTVNDAYFDPGYSETGRGMQIGTITSPVSLGGLTDVWAGFTVGNSLGSATESNAITLFQLQTSGGQGIVRLQQTASVTRQFQYWNGSAWTSLGTLTGFTTRMGRRIDIRCKIHGSTGEFRIYVDYVLQFSLTGNTNFFSATIDNFQLNGWGNFNGRTVSEVCIADEDTRKIRIKSGAFTGNSATNTGWTGGFANLDELMPSNYTASDADASVSSAGSQAMSFTKTALGSFGDDGAILGVSISVRAKNDGSSADFDMLLRTGGTNYTKSHGRTINTTNTNGYYACWSLNPDGNVAWTKSAVDACELGFLSKNAGVSTIYLASWCVAIRDDFEEPWSASYPTDSGMQIVEVTAPGSTGYADITIPDMVTDGCSPTFALFLTNTGTSGSANAGSVQHFGFCANERRAEFSGKGMVGYRSDDASNSSNTLRYTQNRSLKDFASSNGGWVIDGVGLRVRFEKFIKGGIRVFYETTTSGRKFSVLFTWGSDLKVQYWTQNLGTVTTAQAVTGIGFKPDGALFFSAGNTIGNTTTAYYSIGMAADDGGGLAQRCLMRISPTAIAAGPAPVQQIDNTAIGGLLTSAGAVTWDLTLNSFDTDGYTVQASASAVSATLYSILFHDVTGKKMKLVDITTPTVTGSSTHNGLGFTPGLTFGVTTSLQALNSIEVDNEPASSCGFFMTDSEMNVCSVAMAENSVTDPSDCNSYQDIVDAMRIGTNAGTVAEVVGALTAYNTDGITINYTTVSATQKKGFYMALEAAAGGPPPGVGSSENGLIIICM